MARTFETVEALLKTVKSDTTPTTLAVTAIDASGSVDIGGHLSVTGSIVNYVDLDTPLIYTAEIVGNGSGTDPGAGAIGTGSSPEVDIFKIADQIITTIKVDLTGLKSKSDDNDVIGLEADAPPAYLTKITTAINGLIHKTEMTCVELPTAAANPLLDIDLLSDAAADAGYDSDGAAYTAIITAGGNWAAGLTKTATAGTNPAADDYLYLCDGATHTAASVFTGGQFIIKLYGYQLI